MSGGYYKKYARDYRVQTTEETFKDGQVFTRAPLGTGKSRLLVNYDFINNDEYITNRKGLRTTLLGLPIGTELMPTLTSSISITQSKDAVTEDDKHYRLIVANSFNDDDEEVPNANLFKAPAEFWVLKTDDSASYNMLSEYDIDTKSFYAFPLTHPIDSTEDPKPKAYYTVPTNPEVHGIKLTNRQHLARPIGAFAWGNDYYNFNTSGKLIRTRYATEDTEANTDAIFYAEEMQAKSLSVADAMSHGFNMLSDSPFTFTDSFITGTIQLDGILLYDQDSKIVTEPLINNRYNIRCFYKVQSGVKYKFVWDYREVGATEYTAIKTVELTSTSSASVTEPTALTIDSFNSAAEDVIIRIQAFKYSGSSYESIPEKTLTLNVPFSKAPSSPLANKELINYDLTKATGMVYWKNRIWLYGLAQDPTVIFSSDLNEPTYFPYPNGIDIFDEPVIALVPFNDTLLAFTKTQLIQLTLSTDGGWTKKTLQSNLDFQEFDARFIQVVKNMVFFKSGDYYYMIVPKTLSLQNELALAPVSKNIEYFLDEFETNVKNLFEILYDYTGESTLVNHYNFLNYEDVHNVYTFSTESGLFLNLVLLYNTVNRTWRIYTYESQTMYYPLKQDATKQSVLMTPVYIKTKTDDDASVSSVGIQFIETSRNLNTDLYIPRDTLFRIISGEWQEDAGAMMSAFEAIHTFKNWQVLDTGYRDQEIDYNKRYRELQIKFNNVGKSTLKFITEFIIDGDTRVDRYRYATEHIIDPSDPNYGLIYITRTPVENLEVPGVTILAEDEEDLNAWTLDNSMFPEIAFWKARLKVSGKGYTPRFRLISRTEERYELLGYTWVYRQLYSR